MKCIVSIPEWKGEVIQDYFIAKGIAFTMKRNIGDRTYDYTIDSEEGLFFKLKFPRISVTFENQSEISI
jgi:hypothetical protein